MATPYRFKRSAVAGKRPTLSDLELGEIALNTYDGKLYAERETNGVGIADTVALLNPWEETYGGGSIEYVGTVTATTYTCLLYTSPSPRDKRQSRMPSSA